MNNITKKMFVQLRHIKQLRKYLSDTTTATLIHALITSNLDYCNTCYINLPQNQINKLQKIQNTAARLVAGIAKQHHITTTLKKLHWLPIKQRILYKLAINFNL